VLCEANNPDDMARAVRQLFSEDVREIGRAARQHVEGRYSWDTVVAGLLKHYQAVLGHRLPVLAHG
jgi:alpha-1,6-mannosyltransferase